MNHLKLVTYTQRFEVRLDPKIRRAKRYNVYDNYKAMDLFSSLLTMKSAMELCEHENESHRLQSNRAERMANASLRQA